jgi:sugar phosphate isomerase/epimerase
MYTRREFGKLTFAGLATVRLPALAHSATAWSRRSSDEIARSGGGKADAAFAARIDPVVNGVHIGAQTYSFRDLPRTPDGDAIGPVIKALVECGIGEVELYAAQVEPRFNSGTGGGARGGARGQRGAPPSPEAAKAREDLRKWRLETPLDHFREVKKKFDAAGITIYAYNYSPNASYTDAEIARGFEMAKALGAEIITASTTLEVARRIAPLAEKHQMVVAMHGHSNVSDPNEFATPDSFAAAMKMSRLFKVNLDIGHFTAANFDAVAYIREHHADITNLHLKDRKRNQGDNVPWGQGDVPIREVLELLKREKWPIRAYIEYEYRGEGSPVDEVKKCMAFARAALA